MKEEPMALLALFLLAAFFGFYRRRGGGGRTRSLRMPRLTSGGLGRIRTPRAPSKSRAPSFRMTRFKAIPKPRKTSLPKTWSGRTAVSASSYRTKKGKSVRIKSHMRKGRKAHFGCRI
jgi:hypothetical protein